VKFAALAAILAALAAILAVFATNLAVFAAHRQRQPLQTGLNSGLERRSPPTHHEKTAKTAMFTIPVNIAAPALCR
jgi:hypothetical protein